MRINKMMTYRENTLIFYKFSQLILTGNARRSVWRICMWILGLKGLNFSKNTLQLVCTVMRSEKQVKSVSLLRAFTFAKMKKTSSFQS